MRARDNGRSRVAEMLGGPFPRHEENVPSPANQALSRHCRQPDGTNATWGSHPRAQQPGWVSDEDWPNWAERDRLNDLVEDGFVIRNGSASMTGPRALTLPDWRTNVGRVCVALVAVLMIGLCGSPALAIGGEPRLEVTNVGQPSAPVVSGQPPLTITSSGTCGSPFSLSLESACSPSVWPGFGGTWSPVEAAAGGDALQLVFSSPMSSVVVASTSNYAPGLTDPNGQSVSNYDVLGPTPATSTPTPTTWVVTLPAFDLRALSGYTLSVVARDSSGDHDYAFMVRSPRYANEATRCGTAYYSTGNNQYLCLEDAAPPGRSTAPTSSASQLGVSNAGYAQGRLHLKVTVPASGKLTITARTLGRRKIATIVRHVQRRGLLAVKVKVTGQRPGVSRRVAFTLVLRAPGGLITRRQTISLRF